MPFALAVDQLNFASTVGAVSAIVDISGTAMQADPPVEWIAGFSNAVAEAIMTGNTLVDSLRKRARGAIAPGDIESLGNDVIGVNKLLVKHVRCIESVTRAGISQTEWGRGVDKKLLMLQANLTDARDALAMKLDAAIDQCDLETARARLAEIDNDSTQLVTGAALTGKLQTLTH